jgi:hypothetical protein
MEEDIDMEERIGHVMKFWNTIKPTTRKEWFKFALDIFIVILFVWFITLHAISFREGYETGLIACRNNLTQIPIGLLLS